MEHNSLKTFVHPHSVYRLQYPSHWEMVVQKDGESCGFGPYDRDDVGLWISIMGVSLDVDKLTTDLPELMRQAMAKSGGENLRSDERLRHAGFVADMTKEGQGGQYWIVAAGDVVLFASSQVPIGERSLWGPPFQQLMSSLQITRDDQLLLRRVAKRVLDHLRESRPEQEFEFDGDKIRGRNQTVFLSNLFREVRASPKRIDEIVKRFTDTLRRQGDPDLGNEQWEDVRDCIVPMLKPRSYVQADSPTQHVLTNEWLADVLICYVIRREKMLRFITEWDLGRWGTNAAALHELAIANLARLPWPEKIKGARAEGSGHVIMVDTDDSLASSRLLHPDLHKLFRGALGSQFWAGIPCRDTLVLYSNNRVLRQRIRKQLRKDNMASAYPVTLRPFLVTQDGVAPEVEK